MKVFSSFQICRFLSALTAIIVCSACSTAYNVKSDPVGASVYINDKLMGRTPLRIAQKDLPLEESLQLKIVKDEFGTFTAVIPGPKTSTLGEDIFARIPKDKDETSSLNNKMDQIMHAHKLALDGRYQEALRIVDQVIEEDPKLVTPQMLKASIFFLSKNYTGASSQYRHVLEIDPTNREAVKMLDFMSRGNGQ
jgi:hypothetical protein